MPESRECEEPRAQSDTRESGGDPLESQGWQQDEDILRTLRESEIQFLAGQQNPAAALLSAFRRRSLVADRTKAVLGGSKTAKKRSKRDDDDDNLPRPNAVVTLLGWGQRVGNGGGLAFG